MKRGQRREQLRRCTEIAERHHLDAPHELVFFDAALSGTAKDLTKRDEQRPDAKLQLARPLPSVPKGTVAARP